MAPLGIEPRCSVEKFVFARPLASATIHQARILLAFVSTAVYWPPLQCAWAGVKIGVRIGAYYESLPVLPVSCWLLPCFAPAAPGMSGTNTTLSSHEKASSGVLLRTDQTDQAKLVAQGRGATLSGRCPTLRRSIATMASIDNRTDAQAVHCVAP